MADGDLWRDRNKVFVAGLPLHVDDDALYEKFKSFGEMHQSKVVYDQKTGRSRGFGFVTYCEYTNALDAVDQLNQSKWEKRTLNVRFLQPKSGSEASVAVKRPSKVIGPRPEGCMTIYVGNLAYDITEEVLKKVFDKCGSIRAVRFAEHIQTQEFRGFGYVQFHEEGPCEEAVKLDGMVVMGRPMNIDYGARDEGYAQARDDLQKKLKKGICHKFQQGQCTRGDDCKFAHVMQDQDAEDLVQPADRPVSAGIAAPGASLGAVAATPAAEQTNADPDAPVCINFQKGKCKRGSACKFQHLHGSSNAAEDSGYVEADAEDSGYAEADAEAEAEPEEPEEEKTLADEGAPACQNYQKGKCKRGAACRFRHIAAPVGVAEVAVCRNFQNGTCMRGASCRFAHTGYVAEAAPVSAVEEVSEYQKRFQSVCYNWQRNGSCVRGGNCPFQHDGVPEAPKATEDDKPIKEKKVKKHKKHKKEVAEEEEEGKATKHKKHKKEKKRKAEEEADEEETKKLKKHKKHKKHKKESEDSD
ncbi:hypothetical protein BBO99_00000221 [Phytophthora kernoviae]|uniref:Uncharacterized protein n=1 Tax=Phytophthora kernoviae TaxID=325452 RepID=A0A3R7JCI4_9STRA|nr:hypothetical protein BBI17_000369 [Phytophthora kernoviae]RLN85681.1 hypothetical protein BBO99_00000221 [Phytophthora kernoviae]